MIRNLRDRLKRQLYLYRLIPKGVYKNNGKIKLAIVTGQLAAGGVERVLLNILEGLPSDEFEVAIYVTDLSNNTWMDKFQHYGNVFHITKMLNWSTDELLIRRFLETALIVNKPDVLLITNSLIGYEALPTTKRILSTLLKKIRVYDLLHTHGTPEEKDAFLRTSQPFHRYITKRIVISNYLKTYLCDHYPVKSSSVVVIYNGLPKNNTLNVDTSKGGSILNTTENQKVISYIGRLQQDKSPRRLIELARISKDILEDKNAFIAIVGEGNLRDELEDLSKEYGLDNRYVRFLGYNDTPLDIMSASTFTILTSNLEGVPMSILESMSIGIPVIAPNVGGIPEILEDGSSGILVDFTAAQDESEKMLNLRDGLLRALSLTSKELKTMKENAIVSIDNNFKHMEDDYINLFKGK